MASIGFKYPGSARLRNFEKGSLNTIDERVKSAIEEHELIYNSEHNEFVIGAGFTPSGLFYVEDPRAYKSEREQARRKIIKEIGKERGLPVYEYCPSKGDRKYINAGKGFVKVQD